MERTPNNDYHQIRKDETHYPRQLPFIIDEAIVSYNCHPGLVTCVAADSGPWSVGYKGPIFKDHRMHADQ